MHWGKILFGIKNATDDDKAMVFIVLTLFKTEWAIVCSVVERRAVFAGKMCRNLVDALRHTGYYRLMAGSRGFKKRMPRSATRKVNHQ